METKRIPLSLLLASLFVVLTVSALPAAADGGTLTVNSTEDTVDANVGDDICADSNGNCTLRAAVIEANAGPIVDEIIVPAGTFNLTVPGTFENAAATGDLDVLSPITIIGAGAEKTVINGKKNDRIFDVRSGALAVSGVTLTKGKAPQDGEGGCISVESDGAVNIAGVTFRKCRAYAGAALRAVHDAGVSIEGSLFELNKGGTNGAVYLFDVLGATVVSSTFIGNVAGEPESFGGALTLIESVANISSGTFGGNTAHSGGAIYAAQSDIVIARSTLHNNLAAWGGGADFESSTVTISDSVIEDNSASVSGGGLYYYAVSEGAITGTTIIGNTATNPAKDASGGGIVVDNATVTATSATISGNKANIGGGVYVRESNPIERSSRPSVEGVRSPPAVSFEHVTIAGNRATERGGGIAFDSGTFDVSGSILDGNKAASGQDCSSTTAVEFVYSLISSSAGCTVGGSGNILNQSAGLGPLIYMFPGITLARVPGVGSPALGARPSCSGDDQRGIARPGNDCDIGAVEVSLRELLVNGNFEDGLSGWKFSQKLAGDKVNGKAPFVGHKALMLKGKPGKKTVLKQNIVLPLFTTGDEIVAVTYVDMGSELFDFTVVLRLKYDDGSTAAAYVDSFEVDEDYESYSTTTLVIEGGKTVKSLTYKLIDRSPAGKRFVDYVTVVWYEVGMARENSGPLPPPAAPDGFRGGN